MPYLPLNLNLLIYLFRVGLALHIIGIYCSTISAYLEPFHYNASNHLIISILMHHFIASGPSCKYFRSM